MTDAEELAILKDQIVELSKENERLKNTILAISGRRKMIDLNPYINPLIFIVEYTVKGELFPIYATYYHETETSIKKKADFVSIRNGWEVKSITSLNKDGRKKVIR